MLLKMGNVDHIMGNMRAVLDTDVLVAALRSPTGASRCWLRAVLSREATLILSVSLAVEYEAVLTRPDHLARIGADQVVIARLLDALCAVCEPVRVGYLWRPVLRDPDDEMVLETAMNGGATHLLTFNERDFAGAGRFNIRIQPPGLAWRTWRHG